MSDEDIERIVKRIKMHREMNASRSMYVEDTSVLLALLAHMGHRAARQAVIDLTLSGIQEEPAEV